VRKASLELGFLAKKILEITQRLYHHDNLPIRSPEHLQTVAWEKLKLEDVPRDGPQLDSLLDDQVLLAPINKEDLAKRVPHPNSKTLARRSTLVVVELIFRMLIIVPRLYDLSYEQTERLVSDSSLMLR
jgi:hypothetical protein